MRQTGRQQRARVARYVIALNDEHVKNKAFRVICQRVAAYGHLARDKHIDCTGRNRQVHLAGADTGETLGRQVRATMIPRTTGCESQTCVVSPLFGIMVIQFPIQPINISTQPTKSVRTITPSLFARQSRPAFAGLDSFGMKMRRLCSASLVGRGRRTRRLPATRRQALACLRWRHARRPRPTFYGTVLSSPFSRRSTRSQRAATSGAWVTTTSA